jgi:hypothetical protein
VLCALAGRLPYVNRRNRPVASESCHHKHANERLDRLGCVLGVRGGIEPWYFAAGLIVVGLKQKSKGKGIPVHAIKPYGVEVQLHAFLTSGLEGEWAASRPARTLCRVRTNPSSRYPLSRSRGGPDGQSRRFGEERNLMPLSGIA